MAYTTCTVPAGEKISISKGVLQVPNNPIVPFIRGDGTGPDIWASSVRVFDAAVEKAYGGQKKISWMEVSAGEASFKQYNNWLPDDTVEAFKEFLVGIKGPLTTPVGGGIRSLNVALRQMLDLYVCLRPVQYFTGVPSPVKAPEKSALSWSTPSPTVRIGPARPIGLRRCPQTRCRTSCNCSISATLGPLSPPRPAKP